MSRQNLYKVHKDRKKSCVDSGLIVELVKAERAIQPRIGGKKLYYMFKSELQAAGVDIGRDRFFKVLGANNLLLDPLPKAPRTTNSRHCLPVFRNILKEMDITGPNMAWVSDITYIRTGEDFLYLSLITDRYSRKVVGYYVGETLEAEECIKALNQAVIDLPECMFPLHHSDRGCQYCSHAYTDKLKEYGMEVSMTEENHCYENAIAERVNGILKQEYWLGSCFKTKEQAVKAVDQAVMLYNTRRPHQSLNYKTPEEVHKNAA